MFFKKISYCFLSGALTLIFFIYLILIPTLIVNFLWPFCPRSLPQVTHSIQFKMLESAVVFMNNTHSNNSHVHNCLFQSSPVFWFWCEWVNTFSSKFFLFQLENILGHGHNTKSLQCTVLWSHIYILHCYVHFYVIFTKQLQKATTVFSQIYCSVTQLYRFTQIQTDCKFCQHFSHKITTEHDQLQSV